MPEPGGPTTQSGILYQNSIAALFLGRLCDATSRPENDRVAYVRVETPDNVDDIVVTFADNHNTYIQAKEEIRASDNAWKKLWSDFEQQFQAEKFQKGRDRLALWVGSYREDHRNLQELCQRAISSSTYEDWQSRLTDDQRETLEKVKTSLHPEILEISSLVTFFRHIDVEIHPNLYLERDEAPRWMPITSFTSYALFRLLRDRVGGASRIREEFTAHHLLHSLVSENPSLEFLRPLDIDEIKGSLKSSSSLLRSQKTTIANTSIHLRRNIVDEIVNWIINSDDDTKNLAMLIDQAGTGKTVTLHDVLVDLEDKGYDVLGIKADQQLSGIIRTTDISEVLGLPQSLEQILGRLSQQGRVAVLIDQIDALSLSLAHDQTTLDVVLDLIARLRRIPNLRILISCRLFDRNSDPRLKQIDFPQQFTLAQFTEDEVIQVFGGLKISFRDLSKPTQVLLQTPLHLNLFALALENDSNRHERLLGITSLLELYGAIWEYIVLKEDSRAPSKADRVEVLRFLKNYMTQHQQISVPRSALLQPALTNLEHATVWLASAGILIPGKNDWTFIHQTFYDFCYAKEFVEQGGDLVSAILISDQGLFVRPQLIQVISYMRGTNPTQYLRDLITLVTAGSLRFHLFDLLLRWFGSLPDPSDDEWRFAYRLLISQDKRKPFLERIFGNPGWFERLKNTLLPKWLSNEKAVEELVLYYIVSILDLEVTQLSAINFLKPYLGKSAQHGKNISWITSHIQNWHTPQAVDFYEQAIYLTSQFDRLDIYQIGRVAKAYPRTGVRLLRFLLDYVLAQYDEMLLENRKMELEGTSSRLYGASLYTSLHKIESHDLEEVFREVSRTEPKMFVDAMVPWLEQVLSRREVLEDYQPYYFGWDELSSNWYNEHQGVDHAFIFSLIDSMTITARSDESYFDTIYDRLDQSPYRTPQLLLASVFKNVPDIYASKACRFILADRRRLELGDVDGYDSRKLIKAIYPYLTESERVQLEEFILQPPLIHKNRGLQGLYWRGIDQYHMLQSIPQSYLSEKALQQMVTWEHKFPGSKPVDDPRTSWGGSVTSPIPAGITMKMTDRQWIRAMNKYHGTVEHQDFLKGGAEQLSTLLQSQVKESPQRFFSLLQKVSDDIDDTYVMAYLNGLAESNGPLEYFIETIRRFSRQPNRNIKRTLAWSLEKRAKENISDDLIDLLENYVHAEPGKDEWLWDKGDNHEDVYSSFQSSGRGAAFRTLMRIYDGQGDEEANDKKWALIEFVEADPSTALHVGAIHELTYMIRFDRERAIDSFERLLQNHEVLLASMYIREFIYWAFYKNYLRLQPYISRMMEHQDDKVQEQSAQLACIAFISQAAIEESVDAINAARDLAEQTTSPSARLAWKRGAAHIFAHNITEEPKDVCVKKLSDLLNEDDKQIHDSISRVFYSLKEEHIFSLRDFIQNYAQKAKCSNHKFAEYISTFGLLDPEWTLSIIDLTLLNNALIDQTPWSAGIEDIIRLDLRIYTDSTVSAETRKKSMDLFDVLMERKPVFSNKVLSEWDQR